MVLTCRLNSTKVSPNPKWVIKNKLKKINNRDRYCLLMLVLMWIYKMGIHNSGLTTTASKRVQITIPRSNGSWEMAITIIPWALIVRLHDSDCPNLIESSRCKVGFPKKLINYWETALIINRIINYTDTHQWEKSQPWCPRLISKQLK